MSLKSPRGQWVKKSKSLAELVVVAMGSSTWNICICKWALCAPKLCPDIFSLYVTEAEKRVREKRKHKKKRVKPESATTLAAVVADPSSRVSEASESTDSQVDLHDSCIWDSSEIEVLRKVFKTAKTENLKLTAELVATKDHLERLQSKHKKKCDSLDQSAKQLSDAKKANQRLNILSKNLKAELDKSNAKVDYLREELLETGDERAALAKETHALQLELDRERIERRRLEILLEDHNAETLKALRLQDSKLRVQHETEVGVLQRKLKELTLELHEERKDHTRTKRGLDHLRTHFSSLPLEESDTTSQGPVVTDQLIEFTYWLCRWWRNIYLWTHQCLNKMVDILQTTFWEVLCFYVINIDVLRCELSVLDTDQHFIITCFTWSIPVCVINVHVTGCIVWGLLEFVRCVDVKSEWMIMFIQIEF